MNITELLEEKGFEKAGENKYIKRPSDPENISILLETDEGSLHFRVHCASTTVDHEKEIEDHLKEYETDIRCKKISFCLRLLELDYVCETDAEASFCVDSALAVIEDADRTFGFMPVCSKCDRIIRTQAMLLDDELHTICGICRDGMSLEQSHERLIQEHIEKEKLRRKNFNRNKLYGKFLLAGLVAGIWACLVGLLFVTVYLLVPAIRLCSVTAGATGGFLLIRNLRKINPKLTVRGLLYGNGSLLVTILVVSPLASSLYCKFFELLMFGTAQVEDPKNILHTAPSFMFLGLLVMFLTEFVVSYWLKEDVVEIK